MAVPGLLLAAAFAALGSGSLDALLRQSTGVDLTATVAETLGVPAVFNLSLFTLLAAAIFVWSLWPSKSKVYVLDFAVFSAPDR
jgi:hypothetical protein